MSSLALKIENLSKYYKLGVINNGTLRQDLRSWFALKRGNDDPNSKIGSDKKLEKNGFWALDDINLEINQGDRVGIIGKNGAGKSTLLKIISGITTPTKGNIKIKGRISSLLEVGTGFNPELTGRENIYLNGAILGMKKKEVDMKIDEIIEFSEIEKHIDTPVKRYSSGMYVRLAFAVAAHLDSEILIADEVLAVGDARFQKKALGKMNELSNKNGRTILFVSHQIPAIVSLCNKGVFLKNGQVTEYGSLDNCINLYMHSAETNKSGIWIGKKGDLEKFLLYKVILREKNNCNDYRTSFVKGEKVVLHFEYEIFSFKNDNFVFNIEIFNYKGTQLCSISAGECLSYEEFIKLRSPGKHNLDLEMDTSIFAPGSYIIKFDFAIHNVKRFIEDDPSIAINIITTSGDNSQRAEIRENIISPCWEWRYYS